MQSPGRENSGRGITLIELLVVIAIVGILASAAMPLTKMTVKRTKEMELRSALRVLRGAIDEFRKDCAPALPGMHGIPGAAVIPGAVAVPAPPGSPGAPLKLASEYCKADQDYYPESLEQLTQPLKLAGSVDKTRKYLRRIPRDPMMPLASADNPNNWGLRSYRDEPDSTEWGGENVFDVYSKSQAIATDGSKYSIW